MRIILVVWLLFSPVAGLMAYIITFNEYRHHFVEPRRARRVSLHMALVTMGFFLLTGAVVAVVLPRLLQ